MSIFQEYEETRDDIGHEMFDTIQKYLDAVSPLENYDKYNEELRQYKDLEGQDYINKMEEKPPVFSRCRTLCFAHLRLFTVYIISHSQEKCNILQKIVLFALATERKA